MYIYVMHSRTHIDTYTNAHSNAEVHASTRTHILTQINAYIHACIHTYRHLSLEEADKHGTMAALARFEVNHDNLTKLSLDPEELDAVYNSWTTLSNPQAVYISKKTLTNILLKDPMKAVTALLQSNKIFGQFNRSHLQHQSKTDKNVKAPLRGNDILEPYSTP